jgi:IMP dehydrogenase
MIIREGLTFDDVLLVPQHSEVGSRSDVDISVKWSGAHFKHPIIPANMMTVTGREMAVEIIKSGGLAILHRFMDEAEQLRISEKVFDDHGNEHFAVSVGVKPNDREMVAKFRQCGVRIVCIDIAHGDSKQCIDMTKWIKDRWTDMFVIAGNVSTGTAAERLWRAGADAVKVGVGPGSLCTTRVETGNGVPQLTALMDVSAMRLALSMHNLHGKSTIDRPMYIIADGGIKSAGDVVKALCFADMVMVGNLFAGCTETPGKTLIIDGVSYKEYVGSSTHKANHVEGVAALVPTKGTYQSVLTKLLEGLRSGMSYQGCVNLAELRDNPEFIRITNAGLKESHPHDVILK